jgi:hypothetical protein
MSYILDALNKSEQERQQREHGVSLQPLTGVPHPGNNGSRWLPVAAVAIVLAAVGIFAGVYFAMKAKAPAPLSNAASAKSASALVHANSAPVSAPVPVPQATRPAVAPVVPASPQSVPNSVRAAAAPVAVTTDRPASVRPGTSDTVKSLYQRKGMSAEEAMAQSTAEDARAAAPIESAPVAGDDVKTFASDEAALVRTQEAARQDAQPTVPKSTVNQKALDAEIARQREEAREAELSARVQAELEKMQAQDAAVAAKLAQSRPKPAQPQPKPTKSNSSQPQPKPAEPAPSVDPDANLPLATQLSGDVQKRIPNIDFGAHVYAGKTNNGFVILNGKKRYSGDSVAPGVVVERITEDGVILDMNGTRFKLHSMSSWIN